MMAKLRVLIVDDEPIARRGIRKQLDGDAEIEILRECSNGLEAVSSIEELRPDLVFLDVQMPELDGFAVVEAIGAENMPAVIFVTAYDSYALQAFEVNAVDYLLKPFDAERFHKALERARLRLRNDSLTDINHRLVNLLEDLNSKHKYVERLVIKSQGRIFFLQVEEIDWIDAADNYVRLHVGRESHLLRETVNRLEEKLDPERFLRIRRSVIVNINRIKELHPLFNGEYVIILTNGTELTSSRRHRKRLSSILDQ